jgi:hypothetical protein
LFLPGGDNVLELPAGIEPACDDMCPETEADRRREEGSLNKFEVNPDDPSDLSLVIKAFNRSCKSAVGCCIPVEVS